MKLFCGDGGEEQEGQLIEWRGPDEWKSEENKVGEKQSKKKWRGHNDSAEENAEFIIKAFSWA